MLSKSIEEAINDQINHEFYAAYLYLSMSAYFESQSLQGFASWMRHQAQEEVAHAMRLFDFVHDRNGRVRLLAIQQPGVDFESPLSVFEGAAEHEQKVTGMIYNLYTRAAAENDFATQVALQWFITEQVEEENTSALIVDQLRMIGGDRAALLMLDREMAQRQGEAE